MSKLLRTTALATMLFAALPTAQAATYSFSGSLDSGYFNGQTFSGVVSYADGAIAQTGEFFQKLDSLSMNFLSRSWTLDDAIATAEASFMDGTFLGISYSANGNDIGFTLAPGFYSVSEAALSYDTNLGFSGSGSVVYAPVPEPTSTSMLLAGLGLLGIMASRRMRVC